MDDIVSPKNARARPAVARTKSLIGVIPNAPHQAPSAIFDLGTCQLAIVEFDDQGCCYDRQQMHAVARKLDSIADADAIIVVFVHGWKHDARGDDQNLTNFRRVLQQTVDQEASQRLAGESQKPPRPVFGIFVGWRGMSLFDRFGISENLTFWDRQQAGRRVAVGSIRELFGQLRHYRNRRKDDGGAPLLVIAGHSFGGMIVYSALAQSLIEAATVPQNEVVPRFADLVLLINPAVEAARYLPIQALVDERQKTQKETGQPPVFVCATAQNDWATGLAFPLGNAFSLVTESYKGRRERQAMINTIGHLPWMKTHDLVTSPEFPGFALKPSSCNALRNPFWVVQVVPEIINGHDDIFGDTFLEFVAELVFRHVQFSRKAAIRIRRSGSRC